MKLLILGNSEAAARTAMLADLLSKELGEPVEVITRPIWPNRRAPEHARRCIEEVRPDAIYIQTTDYAFAYPSTPIRLARFGAPGRWLANRTLLVAGNQTLTHNRPVRALRWLLQATIGGDTHVTPEEGIATYLEIVRIAARQEDTFVAVKGPWGSIPWGATRRQHRKAEETRLRFHHTLKDLCETLHLPFSGSETPAWADPENRFNKAKDEFGGDGLHTNSLGDERAARQHLDVLVPAYRDYLASRG